MWIVFELLFVAVLVLFDLFSKWATKSFLLTQGGHYNVLEGIIEFQYVENDGASFGFLSGNQTLLIVITAITVLLLIGILFFRPKTPKLFRYSILTIIGGAIGNLFDRIAFGYVRDFIDYTFLKTWFNIDFAVGNIADIFCLVGMLMIIVYILFQFKESDFKSHKKLEVKARNGKT